MSEDTSKPREVVMQSVDSKLIDYHGYDHERSELHVKFKKQPDTLYVYEGVSPQTRADMLDAESIGSFLLGNVTRVYTFRKYVGGVLVDRKEQSAKEPATEA